MDQSQATDEDVAIQVQHGDVSAFAEIMRRYQDKLIRYGYRFLPQANDVEDVVQEVFLKTYTNFKGYNSKQKFSSWIYRIAHNTFIDVVRARKNEPVPFFDPDELWPHPVATDDQIKETDNRILRRQLDACLNELELKYREPLALRYYDDLSYKDIGAVLRLPAGTVSIRIKRGLEKLAEHCRLTGLPNE